MASLLRGGGQERGIRAGSENVPAIAGFGAAAADVPALLADAPRLARLRDELQERLLAGASDAVVFGAGAERLPNTLSIAMPGAAAETQVIALDLAGFAVSAGAACSSGKVAPSHVLAAMGVPEALARTAIRVSLGWHNTAAETGAFARAWLALHARFSAPRAA
jgi:cysteine desulfurase